MLAIHPTTYDLRIVEVGDLLPPNVKNNGSKCEIRTLSNEEYLKELNRKLDEEIQEFKESEDIYEIADILEVLMALAQVHGYDWDDITTIRLNKREERGGFNDRIMLISTD